jgi:hypothetical protein
MTGSCLFPAELKGKFYWHRHFFIVRPASWAFRDGKFPCIAIEIFSFIKKSQLLFCPGMIMCQLSPWSRELQTWRSHEQQQDA